MGKAKRFLAGLVFITYTLFLLYWMFFAYFRTKGGEFRYNLTPFSTIKNYFTYYDHFPFYIWIINIAGNIGVFIPFGIVLPILFPKLSNFFLFFIAFIFGIFSLEFLQLISKLGSFDVDDIILNTVGAVIGYILLQIIRLKNRRKKRR
ncbi:VanZ family protein [Bacillus sp. REN16]|uniref:VanZ family protein n=1 Tax=Bacillus sp. REN16 TaxID=2887296 RepID=UPI001E55E67A|nr:VanZ family protein [Bacillus sp. REN16]MCC3358083.1 VanZ family protein [Bacillus sp. REN16]